MTIYKSKCPTKDGRQWFFRIKYKDVFGNVKDYTSKKFKLKSEALDCESKYRTNLNLSTTVNNQKTYDELFSEFIERKDDIKIQTKLKTLRCYDHHLKDFIGNVTPQKLSINLYEKTKTGLLNKGLSSDYTNKILGIIDQINNYSKKYYGIYSSIPSIVGKIRNKNKIKKEMLFFSYEEYLSFISVVDSHMWKTFFEFLFFMGTRQGETTALTWKDVDFSKNIVSINKTITTKIMGEDWTISSPKTKSSFRDLPLTTNLINDLKELKIYYEKFSGFNETWFIFGGMRPLIETTIRRKKNIYCKRANVKEIRIHDFRHSCASLLINKGASITLVSKYLGHSNISITLNTYTHMYQSELENMTNILNKL